MKRTVRRRFHTGAAWISLMFVITACGGDDSDDPLMCVEINPQCTAAFPATWDAIYKNLIDKTCGGSDGVTCHGSQGKMGGLVLYPQTQAYDELLKGSNGHGARVIPMDAACSVLTERLETTDPKRWMPYLADQRLSASERCAVEQWIAQGAAK